LQQDVIHEMKFPPLPLPPFYKEPTESVLQSMVYHGVQVKSEKNWKEQPKKGKSLPYCSDKILQLLFQAISLLSLSPAAPQPVWPHLLRSQEESLPKQCQNRAGIQPAFT